jgi:hypothetical protein
MSKIDHIARPAGPPDDGARPGTCLRRLARLKDRLQDWISGPDERFAAERGWTATRSSSGWSVTVRDPRFDRRHVCDACDGGGRHRITGAECPDCGGAGVVTDPERGEQS